MIAKRNQRRQSRDNNDKPKHNPQVVAGRKDEMKGSKADGKGSRDSPLLKEDNSVKEDCVQ